MKSYLENAPQLACGINLRTDPGNSGLPPANVPVNMVVVVSSQEWQSGSNELGNVVHLVVDSVQPSYAGDPGHAGWGNIIGTIC
jgi:hypothetical protein